MVVNITITKMMTDSTVTMATVMATIVPVYLMQWPYLFEFVGWQSLSVGIEAPTTGNHNINIECFNSYIIAITHYPEHREFG